MGVGDVDAQANGSIDLSPAKPHRRPGIGWVVVTINNSWSRPLRSVFKRCCMAEPLPTHLEDPESRT
jgi:hypothetical protein